VADKKKSFLWLIIIAVVVIGVWLALKEGSGSKSAGGSALPSLGGKTNYQVVFLDTEQAYVGKVQDQGEFIKLSDAYRLFVRTGTEENKETNIELARVDESFHGPTDTILINRDHVTLIQQLRTDSKLLDTIKNYQSPNPKK